MLSITAKAKKKEKEKEKKEEEKMEVVGVTWSLHGLIRAVFHGPNCPLIIIMPCSWLPSNNCPVSSM